jgi:uncharacterized membrane protein
VEWFGLVAAILGIVALRRTGELRGRIRLLEDEILDLRGRGEASPEAGPTSRPAETPRRQPPESADVTWAQEPIDVPAAPAGGGSTPSPSREPAPTQASPPTSGNTPPQRPRPPAGPPSSPRGPRIPKFDVDWESWLGVRGAAVLGGVVLALAGLYFFQYSIENNLIPPWLRVTSGTLIGLACILGAEWKARERYPESANAIVGAGVVILYAAIWAARVLYDLIGLELAFGSMIAVTAACTALSYRHTSLVIAMIGLVGGFATPLMLATGVVRPIGLFAYLLMLDSFLLFVSYKRGWPVLALLSLIATAAYQVQWILSGMTSGELLLALTILGVFGLLFGLAARNAPDSKRGSWLVAQGGGLLFPFAFAIYFASHADFGAHFYPLAMLLALLSASAGWLSIQQRVPWLGMGAASGSVAVFGVWALTGNFDLALAWEATACAVGLAAVFHAFVEWKPAVSGRAGPAMAASVAAAGMSAVLILAGVWHGVALWPWLMGWQLLAALMIRHATFPARAHLQLWGVAAVGIGLWAFYTVHGRELWFPPFGIYAAALGLPAVVLQCVAMLRNEPIARRAAEHAAALFPLLMLFTLGSGMALDAPAASFLGVSLLLGALALLPAARLGSGGWVFAATVLTALIQTVWTDRQRELAGSDGLLGYQLQVISLLIFASWPFVAVARFKTRRWAWYAVALSGPLWFESLRRIHLDHFGDAAIGLLPVALGALTLLAAGQVRRIWAEDDPLRKSNLAWMLAVAMGFGTVAIPLQLEKEWITIGWALEAAAVAVLWRRLDHAGLKYFSLALVMGAALRLVANEAVLGYYPRPSVRIVNWLLYTYGVSAASALYAARVFGTLEVERVREWEQRVYEWGQPIAAGLCGLVAIAIGFVWINLAIADWFATGSTLELSFQRLPARDLTTSIAWALYAVGLLAAGVRMKRVGARWLSLGLLLVTVGKVFLYDLGELEDLYRVASLLGLAVSLIGVSFAYQRFVVRAPDSEASQ